MVSDRKSPFRDEIAIAVDALRDERLEDFLLPQLVGISGPRQMISTLPQLRRLALGADLGVVEHRQIERFGMTAKRSLARLFRCRRRRSRIANAAMTTPGPDVSYALLSVLSLPQEHLIHHDDDDDDEATMRRS